MYTLDDFMKEQLQDDSFKEEWDKLQPEREVMQTVAKARMAMNMSQQELAEKTGIDQADISKLENGTRNPTLKLLSRLADGLDMVLRVQFIPKNH